ncbi:MAG: cell division protein FtsZ [Candidatus Aenigmatarchaeota archaeon]
MPMDSLVKSALARTIGNQREDRPETRFRLEPTSGATFSNVDYYKLAEQEFGFSVRKAKIAVVGCGGAGSNTVTRLTEMGIEGATTIALNTDAKALAVTKADKKILIGKELTKGLGCGGYPEIGRKAAEESRNEIKECLEGVDLLFAIAGLGKGTGTGSIPVVCELAKSMGAIVIAVVTMPFKLEGARVAKAEDGLARLRQVCDTAIVIENDKLLKYAGNLSIQQAFAVADELIASMVKGITETITLPSLVNLDYADVKSVMHTGGGVAAIGVGESNSSDRAKDAITRALENPLLEVDYTGAQGALVHITGGPDLRLEEVNLIGETVSQYLDPSAQVFWGARILPEFEGKVQVIAIITGVKSPYILGPVSFETPVSREISQTLGIDIIR